MDFQADSTDFLDCVSFFEIEVSLTKKGLANSDKVIDIIFTYMQRIRDMGPQKWIFEEKKQMGNIAFDFAEKRTPMAFIIGLARYMAHLKTPEAMSHVIRHTYVADVYKPDLLA